MYLPALPDRDSTIHILLPDILFHAIQLCSLGVPGQYFYALQDLDQDRICICHVRLSFEDRCGLLANGIKLNYFTFLFLCTSVP